MCSTNTNSLSAILSATFPIPANTIRFNVPTYTHRTNQAPRYQQNSNIYCKKCWLVRRWRYPLISFTLLQMFGHKYSQWYDGLGVKTTVQKMKNVFSSIAGMFSSSKGYIPGKSGM